MYVPSRHSFRLGEFACRILALKLSLIDIGLIDEAENLDQKIMTADNKEGIVRSIEERIKDKPVVGWISGEVKARRRDLIKEFLSVRK